MSDEQDLPVTDESDFHGLLFPPPAVDTPAHAHSADEVSLFHDVLGAYINGHIRGIVVTPQVLAQMEAAYSVLSWQLGYDAGDDFDEWVRQLQDKALGLGYVLVTNPGSVPNPIVTQQAELPSPRPCTRCGTMIYDLKHAVTGRTGPIEAIPHPNGNVYIRADGAWEIIPVAQRDAQEYQGKLRLNHFSTCPAAEHFGKNARKGPAKHD